MNRKYLAVVTARGGSKGIPNKNIKLLNGLPLIEYTIEAGKIAQKEGFLSRLIVSTDSEEIAHVSVECGAEVPFLRPKELGLDNTKSVDVILDVLEKT